MKPITDLPVDHYLDLLEGKRPFTFARFGDGEVLCMHNTIGLQRNCDGSFFFKELIEPMKQIFRNQYPYYHCLLQCSFDLEGAWFKRFIDETCPEMPFYNGEVWQGLSFGGQIQRLVTHFNSYKTCIVGPSHIRNVQHIKGINTQIEFIETPPSDSFGMYQQIFESVMKKHAEGCRLFGFSTGYTSKILIDNLFPYLGYSAFLIDFGSVFDPYCGVLSRSGMVSVGYDRFQPYTNHKLG